jgi:hypothetical protein
MAALAPNASLGVLADILHAAAVLGPDAWGGGEPSKKTGGDRSLGSDLHELFTLLRQRNVQYLLVGGVALLKYVDGRNTDDIDLLLSIASLEKLPEISINDRNRDFARGKFKSVRVDLRLTENPLFRIVQEKHATTHRFAEIDVPCATVEGLILLKLYALPSLYRQGDGQRIGLYEADIFMLCQRHHPDVGSLLEVLRAHLDQGSIVDLRNIMTDIQKRIERVEKAKGS